MEHVYELDSYVKELKRVLKPGGLLVGSVPTEGGIAWGIGRYLTSRRYVRKNMSFDYDKINGNLIEVRSAKKNEEILCLNNELNKLSIDDIVISISRENRSIIKFPHCMRELQVVAHIYKAEIIVRIFSEINMSEKLCS